MLSARLIDPRHHQTVPKSIFLWIDQWFGASIDRLLGSIDPSVLRLMAWIYSLGLVYDFLENVPRGVLTIEVI